MDSADLDRHITQERLSNESLAWMLEVPVGIVDQWFGKPCVHEYDLGEDDGHVFNRCVKCGEDK